MGGKNTDHEQVTFWKFSAKTSDGATPHFTQVVKEGTKWVDKGQYNSYIGRVTGIEHKVYEFGGDTKNQFILTVVNSEGQTEKLQCGFNNASYNILNSLAGSDLGKEMQIDVSTIENEKGVFAQVWVKFGGEKSSWKYKPEEMPKAEYIPIPGTNKTYKDESKQYEFWINVIAEIAPRLAAESEFVREQPQTPEDPFPGGNDEPENLNQGGVDDLPF